MRLYRQRQDLRHALIHPFLRSSLRPEMSWRSKLLSAWVWKSTIMHGQGAWLCMEVVSRRISYDAPSRDDHVQLTCQCHHSRLRACRDNLVQIPTTKNQSQKPQSHHRRPCSNRSMRLCLYKSLRVSQQHGHHGREKSKGQVREHIYTSAAEKLDGLAVGAGDQFQISSARA